MSTAIALGRPNDRPFACTSWPSFEPGTWASASVPRPGPSDPAPIVAADRDAGAVEAARVHVSVAGVEALVTVEHAALSAQRWPTEPSLVVCNPPYGRWVGGRDLARSVRRARLTGQRRRASPLPARCGRRAGTGDGIDVAVAFSTTNGGIPVRCWLGERRAGEVSGR